MKKDEPGAIRIYEEFIKDYLFDPPNDFMLSTEQWIFHAINKFHDAIALDFKNYKIEGWNSKVTRTIANHDLDWEEVLEFEHYAIKLLIMNEPDAKVTVFTSLVESPVGRDRNADDVVIRANTFFYYTASPLIRKTKEFYELQESFDRDEIDHIEFATREKELANKQLEERWAEHRRKRDEWEQQYRDKKVSKIKNK